LPGALPNGGGDDARFTRTILPVNSPSAYTSYRLIFPTVKDAAAANSMQIADIQFFTVVPEPAGLALGCPAVLALSGLMHRPRSTRSP
jgi:hypothetical protein